MTFAIFIVLVFGLFIAGLNILPTGGASVEAFTDGFSLIVGTMKAWDFLLPISEMFICLGIVVTYEVLVWGVHATFRVINWVRGTNTGA